MKYRIYRHINKTAGGVKIDREEEIARGLDLTKEVRLTLQTSLDAGDYLVIAPEKKDEKVLRKNFRDPA